MPALSGVLLVSLFALADTGTDIQGILKQASACAAESGEPGCGLWLQIAVCQAKAGDQDAAVHSFDRCLEGARRIDDQRAKRMFLAQLAEARGAVGDMAGARRTVGAIAEADTAAYAISLVVAAQAKAGEFKAALATANSIDAEATRWKASALGAIAMAEADAGEFAAAIRTAKSIDTIMHGRTDDRALVLADRNWALKEIALAQARAGKAKDALATVATIGEGPHSIQALREIAGIQAEAKDFEGAKRGLEEASRIAKVIEAHDHLWGIARDQAAAGDIKGALQTASQTASTLATGPERACALLAIAAAQTKAGDQDAAWANLREGLRIVRSSDPDSLSYALAEVSAATASSGDATGALEIARVIPEASARAYALRLIAAEQLKRGDVSRALQIATGIDGSYQKAVALREVAVAQTKVDRQAAESTFQEALRAAQAIKNGGYEKAHALREIGAAQVKVDRQAAETTFQEAVRAARAIEIGGGTDVIALHKIGREQAKTGSIAAAAKTFQQARQAATQYKDEAYVAQLFRDIACAQAEGGDAETAIAWAKTLASPIQQGAALLGVASGMLRRKH